MLRKPDFRPMALARPPAIKPVEAPRGFHFEPERPLAASFRARSGVSTSSRPTISIFDYIGDDGFSDARMAGALRTVGDADILVEINSPGGDYFQGVAIYNLLQRHPGAVTVQVLGIAASAASLIAMAADRIEIAANSEIMIHKAMAITMGNEEDHLATIEKLRHVDQSMVQTYAARTQQPPDSILTMMAKDLGGGTFLRGQAAIDLGFADALIDAAAEQPVYADASDDRLRDLDRKLAQKGLSRAERRDLYAQIRNTQDAVAAVTQDADGRGAFDAAIAADLRRLAANIHT